MRKEITDLTTSVQMLTQQNTVLQAKIVAEIANSTALKAAYTAALQGQLTQEERDALTASMQSIDTVRNQLADGAQALADSAAVNAPSN